MGIYNLNNPGRCGSDVAIYDNWAMVNVINKFAGHLDLHDKLAFRRALLITNEARALQQGKRINV